MEHRKSGVGEHQSATDDQATLLSENRVLEERVRLRLDALRKMDGIHIGELNLAEAKIIEAFMWLNRAVFRPARIGLPEGHRAKQG